ncbi:nucleoside deaminase [Gordonia sp. DT30]|uniref:nucleoside deaminase n=1 Tax=Gordonia sp. DT30 TaxID=3416546 RepID=UPI003CEDE434
MTSDDERFLLRAIEVAAASRAHGNHPFGAIIVSADGTELAAAENTVVTDRDPTGHAETNVVRRAAALVDSAELASATLYTSTEPCAMCSGAIYWAGIGAVVFALSEAELLAMTGTDPENPTMSLPCRSVFDHGQRAVTVRGPMPLAGAQAVHEGFWGGRPADVVVH